MIGRLVRIGGVVLDARRAAQTETAGERALAAGWIACNLLAARGVRVEIDGDISHEERLVDIRARDLGGLLAAIAVVPALIDGDTLPLRWRLALRVLGVPLLDQPAARALADGASVAVLTPPRGHDATACTATVAADALGYHVRVAPERHSLQAA